MDVMISSLLKFQIQVLSLGTDLASCKSECKSLDGHLPFLYEGWGQNIHLSWWHKLKILMLVTYPQLSPTEVENDFLTPICFISGISRSVFLEKNPEDFFL